VLDEKGEEADDEEDSPLKEDVKENVASQSDKIYQQQVLKLKTLKGVSTEKQPSRKDNGYLSLEKANGVNYLVFRSYLGQSLFAGVINPNLSRVKALSPAEHSNGKNKQTRIKAKASVVVIVPGQKQPEVEHVEISFLSEADRTLMV
jgi:hypothetical protein